MILIPIKWNGKLQVAGSRCSRQQPALPFFGRLWEWRRESDSRLTGLGMTNHDLMDGAVYVVKRMDHQPPMTGNGLETTYLWWFGLIWGMVSCCFTHMSSSMFILMLYLGCNKSVGGLVPILYVPIYWVSNHPNWLSYFSEGWPNHQPDYIKSVGHVVSETSNLHLWDMSCIPIKGSQGIPAPKVCFRGNSVHLGFEHPFSVNGDYLGGPGLAHIYSGDTPPLPNIFWPMELGTSGKSSGEYLQWFFRAT